MCARLGRVLPVAFAALAAASAHAQQFPTRPVRFVVPYPPGGSNDILARMIVPKMSEQLGHNVVVDNRGGANAIIGSEIVAKAVPDSHTILVIGGRVAVSFSEVVDSTTAQFGSRINAELARWDKIAKPLGITPD